MAIFIQPFRHFPRLIILGIHVSFRGCMSWVVPLLPRMRELVANEALVLAIPRAWQKKINKKWCCAITRKGQQAKVCWNHMEPSEVVCYFLGGSELSQAFRGKFVEWGESSLYRVLFLATGGAPNPRISIERRILRMAMSQNYQPTPKIGPNQGVIFILADEFWFNHLP